MATTLPDLMDSLTKPPALAPATGYTAQTASLKPDANAAPGGPVGAAGERAVGDNELVQNRVQGIIASASPLMQQAQTRSLQQMNKRGLINSSMAIGAGESALYDAALPIASQDAATFKSAGDLGYSTQADLSKFNAASANDAAQFGADAQNRAGMLQSELESKQNLAMLDAATRTEMSDIEARYKVQMQSQDSAARLFDQISVQMSQIQMNKDMTPEAKRNAMTQLQAQLVNGMNILGSIANMNLSGILNFSGMEGFVDTTKVGGVVNQPGQGTTGGTPTNPPPDGGTGDAPTAPAPASSPAQVHYENQYKIAQMPANQQTYLSGEYAKLIQQGVDPAAAYQKAYDQMFDPGSFVPLLSTQKGWLSNVSQVDKFNQYVNEGMSAVDAYYKAKGYAADAYDPVPADPA